MPTAAAPRARAAVGDRLASFKLVPLQLGPASAARLGRALRIYHDELLRIVQSYRDVALAAGQPADAGRPEALDREGESVEGCIGVVSSDPTRLHLMGVDVPEGYLAIMASALTLLREDLAAARAQLGADRLAPAGRTAVLDAAIAELDDVYATTWASRGSSTYLPEIQRRRLLREGRVLLDEAGRAKLWCICDANLFIQYTTFDQVDWHEQLGVPSVVLVVPTAVTRALDRYKADRDHQRQQRRARLVLPILERIDGLTDPRTPAPVRRGVELLLLSDEPPVPDGFDPTDPDDRIVAAALDFGQRYIGAQVAVLTGDTTMRIKARGQGLRTLAPPTSLELPGFQPDPIPPPAPALATPAAPPKRVRARKAPATASGDAAPADGAAPRR